MQSFIQDWKMMKVADTTFLRLQEGLERLRVETPVGTIESDYGNPFLDMAVVFVLIGSK